MADTGKQPSSESVGLRACAARVPPHCPPEYETMSDLSSFEHALLLVSRRGERGSETVSCLFDSSAAQSDGLKLKVEEPKWFSRLSSAGELRTQRGFPDDTRKPMTLHATRA